MDIINLIPSSSGYATAAKRSVGLLSFQTLTVQLVHLSRIFVSHLVDETTADLSLVFWEPTAAEVPEKLQTAVQMIGALYMPKELLATW